MFSLSKWILCLPNQAQTEPKPLVKLFCVPQVHKTVRLQAHENGNLRHTFLSPRNSSNHSRLPPPPAHCRPESVRGPTHPFLTS